MGAPEHNHAEKIPKNTQQLNARPIDSSLNEAKLRMICLQLYMAAYTLKNKWDAVVESLSDSLHGSGVKDKNSSRLLVKTQPILLGVTCIVPKRVS